MDARRTPPFILHYLASRRPSLAALVVLVIGAASCGIGGQYAIKLLVDAMNAGRRPDTWNLLRAWFAADDCCDRVGSVARDGMANLPDDSPCWVDLRLNLFDYLSGQSMRYFAENVAGSIGQRITSSAGNLGALTDTFVWRCFLRS